MLTDKDIEFIYKQIDDFDMFHQGVISRVDIELSESVLIEFKLENVICITIESVCYTFSDHDFYSILNDLTAQNISDKKEIKRRQTEIETKKRATELTKIDISTYEAESEFFEDLDWCNWKITMYHNWQLRM